MKIQPADISHLKQCVDIVINSELGKVYYSDIQSTTAKFKQAIELKQMHVAIDSSQEVTGFAYICPEGMFAKLPYLRTIAVRADLRGQGIGNRLLEYFESSHSNNANQLYLLVSSFNSKAKKLYEQVGYEQVGMIKDWAIKGVDEYIMMKRLRQSE